MGRKSYDKAFKENAVKLSKQRKNQAELAKEMEIELLEYIEIWYNRSRRDSVLGNLTITEFWSDIFGTNKKVA